MSQDAEQAGREGSRPPAEDGTSGAEHHLPPPAFPPGARRGQVARDIAGPAADLGEALISPDDPIPPRASVPEEAFISPDEPIIRTHPPLEDSIDPDDVLVTGIGHNAHLDPEELAMAGDPYVTDLVEQVVKLAEALRRKGEAGLRTTPEMTRFEATLRAYCVGYLAGRRAEDEA